MISITLEHLPDGKLWKSFGIVLESGQGAEMFVFDKEVGLDMFDCIAHISLHDQNGKLAHSGGVIHFTKHTLVTQLDEFLYDYFFKSEPA